MSILILTLVLFSQDYNAVVKVDAEWKGNKRDSGSGVVIHIEGDEGYIATCKHVVENSSYADITWLDGVTSRGSIVGRGQNYDTAIIKVNPIHSSSYIPLADEPAPQYADVEVYGYGGNRGLIKWASKVRGYKKLGNGDLIVLDPNAKSGDSGGPIIYNCSVVGLVSGGELQYQNGPPIDSHGPYCRPIKNLLQAILCPGNICAQTPNIRQPVQTSPSPISPPLRPVQGDLFDELRKSMENVQNTVVGISDQLKSQVVADEERNNRVIALIESQKVLNAEIQSRPQIDLKPVLDGIKTISNGIDTTSTLNLKNLDDLKDLNTENLNNIKWLIPLLSTTPVGAGLVLLMWIFLNKKLSTIRNQPQSQPQRTVVLESPPRQQVVPDVRFASYEKDSYARAHAFAQEQVSRRYPGSVQYLEAEKELIKQHLAGEG